jgi:hypothetical protein
MKADEKLPDSFYDWLNQCPVGWQRIAVEEEVVNYNFFLQDEEDGNDVGYPHFSAPDERGSYGG